MKYQNKKSKTTRAKNTAPTIAEGGRCALVAQMS